MAAWATRMATGCCIALVVASIVLDVVRIHDHRVRRWFRGFFGELIRDHEQFNLLGSTYLLIAALLAVEIFPQPVAAAALGFTVLGDGSPRWSAGPTGARASSARASRARPAGSAGCLLWAGYVVVIGGPPVGRSPWSGRWSQVWSSSCRYPWTTTSGSPCSPDTR